MKKRNIILFLIIVTVSLVWGFLYWFYVAPNFGPGSGS